MGVGEQRDTWLQYQALLPEKTLGFQSAFQLAGKGEMIPEPVRWGSPTFTHLGDVEGLPGHRTEMLAEFR